MNRTEAYEANRETCLGLIDLGMGLPKAAKMTALFSAFMDKNADTITKMAGEGMAPEAIADAAMAAFREYLANARKAGALE